MAVLAKYPFEGNANDTSGNGLNGTATALTYGTSYGKIGQGALFNGTTSFIALPDSATLKPTTAFTIRAWIKSNANSVGEPSIFNNFRALPSGGSQIDYGLEFDLSYGNPVPNGFLRFNICCGTGNTEGVDYKLIDGAVNLNDNTWHWVVATWDETTMKTYCDGDLVNSAAWSTAPAYYTTTYTRIGSRYTPYGDNENFWKGNLDEVILESGAWTARDIKDYYQYFKGSHAAML